MYIYILMNKLVLLHESVHSESDLIASIRNDCIIKHVSKNTTKEEIRNSVNFTYLTNVAFVWHYPGYCQVPFFYKEEDYHQNESEESHMIYFSKDMVTFMKSLPNGCKVDLLSCNLEDEHFKNEVETLERECGVDIRYSVDQTGNNPDGNWVLESDNVNIKDVYFTEAITAWNGVLNSSRTTAEMANNASTYFEYDSDKKILKLTQSCTWNEIRSEYSAMSVTDYITLQSDETFDGQGFTIDLETLTDWKGLFACSATSASSTNHSKIQNLGILNGSCSSQNAFLVRQSQRFFSISNCYSQTNMISNYASGIVGDYAGGNGYFSITNCYSTGDCHYGIVGYMCCQGSNSTCVISDCYSEGNCNGSGIIGSFSSSSSSINNPTITVTNCYSTGNCYVGIVGSHAGRFDGTCTITNCHSKGLTHNGIAGGACGRDGGTCIIKNCYSLGDCIDNWGSSGILGGNSGINNGYCLVENCYSTGNMSHGGRGAGIIGYQSENCHAINCYSTGEYLEDRTGGIFGWKSNSCTATNCYYIGKYLDNWSGGIFASESTSCTATNCYSTDEYLDSNSGGIFGPKSTSCTATNCYHYGKLKNYNTGGIFGWQSNSCTATNCYHIGEYLDDRTGVIFAKDSINYTHNNTYSARGGVNPELDGTNLLPSPTDTAGILNMLNSLNDGSDPDVFILETSIFEYPMLSFQLIKGCTNILASNYDADAVVDDGSCIVTGEFIITNIPNDLLLSTKNELLDSALNDTSFNNNLENLLENDTTLVEEIFQNEIGIISETVSNDTDKKETIKYIVNKQRELNKATNDTEKLTKYFDIKTDISSTLLDVLSNTVETSKKSLMSNLINNFKNILPNNVKNQKTLITNNSLIASITTAFNTISVGNKNVFLQIVTNDKSQLELNDGDLLIAEFGEDVNVSLAVNGSNIKIRKSTDTNGNDVIVYGGLEYTVGDIIRVSGGKDILIAGIGSGAFELVERTQAVIYSKNQSATINSLLTLLANAETVGAIVDASLNVLKQE
jgi:hypothetical protein